MKNTQFDFTITICAMIMLIDVVFYIQFQRKQTIDLLASLGFTCSEENNNANGKNSGGVISEVNKAPFSIVIPTNEELVIARETLKLMF